MLRSFFSPSVDGGVLAEGTHSAKKIKTDGNGDSSAAATFTGTVGFAVPMQNFVAAGVPVGGAGIVNIAASGQGHMQLQPQQLQLQHHGGFPPATTLTPVVDQDAVAQRMREAQVGVDDKKKQKNREHAKKSRNRKKVLFQSLEQDVLDLQQENRRLRALVKSKLPDHAQAIIGECCYKQPLPDGMNAGEAGGDAEESSELVRSDFDLIESLTAGKQSFVMTDPRLPDNPIVYASSAFLDLTGYARDQVIGRNCRFLQGPGTNEKAVSVVKEAIASGQDATTCILNFKADGTPFWNQFFVAALRDRDRRIVNYVGVQCEVDPPDTEENSPEAEECSQQPTRQEETMPTKRPLFSERLSSDAANPASIATSSRAVPHVGTVKDPLIADEGERHLMPLSMENNGSDGNVDISDSNVDIIDWSVLAEVLEADYNEDREEQEDGSRSFGDGASVDMCDEEETEPEGKGQLEKFFSSPRRFVIRTVRSELVDALLGSRGDVTNPRFLSALELLSSIYDSDSGSSINLSSNLDGSWRSISRPSYNGCLGMNERSDFVYTLGKMSFNMFKPGNVRCSVQDTLNNIKPVCKMDGAPSIAPWSLRRELALSATGSSIAQPNTMLKSYDIAVACTIEPGQFKAKPNEQIPSPPCRLRALQIVQGYFLPDPNTPKRLTVWFTGGKLSPAPPPESQASFLGDASEYGGFDEWKALFGGDHKRTWGESLTVMGAKLFLGAEVPDGMEQDGTMSFALHRPQGGHGRAYVDVLYLDDELLITKGNSGTIHVMTQSGSGSSINPVSSTGVASPDVASADVVAALPSATPRASTKEIPSTTPDTHAVSVPLHACAAPLAGETNIDNLQEFNGKGEHRGEKRKSEFVVDECIKRGKPCAPNTVNPCKQSSAISSHGDCKKLQEQIHAEKRFFDLPSFEQPNTSDRALPAVRAVEPPQSDDNVSHIMNSVETFFGNIF